MRSIVNGFLLILVVSSVLEAQEKSPKAKSIDLSITAVGRQHHPIQTKNRETQEYFDQGITLIYGFNHEEAARSFQRAAELDPASPMPLWGIALAIGPNYNADVDKDRETLAYETIQKAQKLAANAAESERDYVAALATRYSGAASPDYKKLARDYAAAMKSLSAKYPDDLDAATLYAESLMDLNPWKLWSNGGKPAEHTVEIVTQLESVLARNPEHAGANHYYIHALEASPNPERALPSAQRLGTMVPQAGHLVHMPAHIYERTGYFEEAARSNAEAAKVDAAYAEKESKVGSVYDLMYHSHNEHFEAMAASMEGRYSEAKKAAQALTARLLPHAKMMPVLDGFIMTPIWVDVRFGKWEEVLARPEPMKELSGTHAMWRYANAVALAANGKVPEAEKERELFFAEMAAIPPEALLGEMNKARDVLGVAAHVIDARIAAAKGQKDLAIEHWKTAVAIQDTLNYDEPADWYYPVRESLGAAVLARGRASEAEEVFREDLQRNPRNPRSLYGLTQALRAQNRESDASWVETQFNAAWRNADTKLTIGEM
jgi:tetratricopeptide (TPR) repeat protein